LPAVPDSVLVLVLALDTCVFVGTPFNTSCKWRVCAVFSFYKGSGLFSLGSSVLAVKYSRDRARPAWTSSP